MPDPNRANLGQLAGSPFISTATSNYKGVTGDCWAAGTYINKSAICDGLTKGNGIFWRDDAATSKTPTRLTQVIDGTSNTFLLGEDIPELDAHCMWFYANGALGTCAIPPNQMKVLNGTDIYNGWPDLYSFRSRHVGGLNFGLADGSIRFISETINLTTYRALATIADNEPFSLD